eukprot:5378520-Lingulodinium_polyedra.AAC.1
MAASAAAVMAATAMIAAAVPALPAAGVGLAKPARTQQRAMPVPSMPRRWMTRMARWAPRRGSAMSSTAVGWRWIQL